MTHPSSSVKPGEHKWTGVRAGGDPANAYSYEYVRYCELCGMEDTCEDPLPPCAGAPGEQRGETLLVAEESCNHHAPGRPDCLICHPQEGQPLPVAIPPKFRHVCPEWDGLEIDETWPEFEACLCFKPKVEAQPLPAGELFAGLEPVPDGAETYSDFVEARPLPARPQEHVLFEGMARVYDKSEADAYMDALEAQLSRQWVDCPYSQGWWWRFYDGAVVPFPYGVLASHTGPQGRYFIQYPDSRWCDEVGGKWLKIVEPASPISPDKEEK